jgi:hypothetical protein
LDCQLFIFGLCRPWQISGLNNVQAISLRNSGMNPECISEKSLFCCDLKDSEWKFLPENRPGNTGYSLKAVELRG